MRPTFSGVVTLWLLCSAVVTFGQVTNQTPTSASPPAPAVSSPKIQNPGAPKERNPPDMVCFGYYPQWSVQFANGEARYLGYNEPDRYFDGDFYWVADENAWEWHRGDGFTSVNGNYGLSATIEKTACKDSMQNTINPYSAEIYLPQGDMVSGCCRRLKPGEAPIGHHGAPTTAVNPNAPTPASQAAKPAASNAPQAGHPVDQY